MVYIFNPYGWCVCVCVCVSLSLSTFLPTSVSKHVEHINLVGDGIETYQQTIWVGGFVAKASKAW
jgi:hypothetical protein